MLFLLS
ncbi:hypothetical protein CGLO_13268 [Colletotrichum gloeosporioides Cg-14]|nr:hypothetical protein CGLO_13268 [Colletotrichum gloeosporioides Cg-14]